MSDSVIYNAGARMPLTSGSKLGAYEIIAPIGAGGMGEVYRARDPELGRDVAVKILSSAFSADTDRLRRFKQEAQATAALNHPNILALYHIGQQDGSPYLVSELLEGESLRQRLQVGPLPVRKAIDYARQVTRTCRCPRQGHPPPRSQTREHLPLPRMAAQKFSISAWPS